MRISSDVTPATVPYQRCRWCRTSVAVPRLLCSVCGSTDLDDRLSPGFGRIVRLTEASRRHGRPKQRCLVAVDEGFVVPATANGLVGHLQIGLRVRLEVPADEDGRDFVVRVGA